MVGRVLGNQPGHKIDMESTEKALREMGQRLGGSLLEKLLNGDGEPSSGGIDCGKGHRAPDSLRCAAKNLSRCWVR